MQHEEEKELLKEKLMDTPALPFMELLCEMLLTVCPLWGKK